MTSIVFFNCSILNDPTNLDVLGNLMWNSSIVQSSILALGKMKDFQCHNIEHQLCAYTGCNHGMALAVIHPAYYRRIFQYAPEKFARFGVNVLGLNPAGKTEETLAEQAVDALAAFIREIGLDSSFTELGLPVNEEILRKVSETCIISAGSVHPLNREEIFGLLKQII